MDTVFTPICEYRWMKYHCQCAEGHKAEGLSYIDHLSKCPNVLTIILYGPLGHFEALFTVKAATTLV